MLLSTPKELNLSELISAIQKRDILFGVKKPTSSELEKIGNSFEAAGWLSDAADFYGQAAAKSALESLRQKSVIEGDVFLFLKISRISQDAEVPAALLEKCAVNAESLGKIRYAMKAWERLGRVDRAEELRAKVATDGDIVAEAEQSVFIPDDLESDETAEKET